MSATRLGLRPSGAREPIPLPREGRLVIGSSPHLAGLVLEGPGVDPVHCAVGRLKSGGWAVRDLGSAAGTRVDGEPVRSRRLRPGSELRLGEVRLTVVTLDPEPAAGRGEPRLDGRRLGGYRIERPLGRGRTGVVYLALQESLNRSVALKVLDPRHAADAAFVRRFRAEAETAAALAHPNVVTVHDCGEAEGHPFLAMEYMAGGSLEDLVVRSGALPWRAVLDVLHDTAQALDYAESRGIVHRDVKPANLMRGAGGVTKLADLGLATNSEGAERADGPILGTPCFVSPEQARGEPLDARSDLYSLGATAYRLLTGRVPFEGESARAIVRARFEGDPPPVSAAAPDCPAALGALVAAMMARDPAARPASARQVLEEVDRLRAEADDARWAGLADERPGARRWLWVAAGGLGGALLLFLLLLWIARRAAPAFDAERAEEARRVASVPEDAAGEPARAPAGSPREPSQDGEDDPFATLESRLAALDREAREAWERLPEDAADPADRRAALERLARRYDGTATAERAREALVALEAESEAALLRASERAERAHSALALLRERIGWPPAADDGRSLRLRIDAARAFRPADGLAEELAFLEARDALLDELAAASLAALAAGAERADELAAVGRFDELEALLAELALRHAPPPFQAGEPLALGDVRRALEALAERAAALPAERARWLAQAQVRDRQRLAAELGPRGAALEELRALALEPLAARMEALSLALDTEPARAFVGALARDLRAAAEARGLLRATLAAREWRRFAVPDVRGGRGPATVLAVEPEGLVLEGTDEPVPWSRFAEHALWMHQLFHERLERGWTPAERRGIATLLRLVASAEAAALAREALAAERAPEGLLEPWQSCEAWLADGATDAALALEREAAERFLRAGRSAAEGAWERAASEAEGCLELATRSLFAALVSDGSEADALTADAR